MASQGAHVCRATAFTENEISILLTEIFMEREVILSKLNSSVSIKNKAQVWESIAQHVSCAGVATRTADQCRIKWRDLKKDALSQKTADGGPKINTHTVQVLSILDRKCVLRHGSAIDGTESMVEVQEQSTCDRMEIEVSPKRHRSAAKKRKMPTVQLNLEENYSTSSQVETERWRQKYYKSSISKNILEKKLCKKQILKTAKEMKKLDRDIVKTDLEILKLRRELGLD